MSDYDKGVVGAKSRNLAGLRGKLPDAIKLPASITLPFGSYEAALDAPANSGTKKQLKELVSRINALPKDAGNAAVADDKRPSALLQQCRELAMQVWNGFMMSVYLAPLQMPPPTLGTCAKS